MTNRNPITGDKIITKSKGTAFDDNFDAIFRKPETHTVYVEAMWHCRHGLMTATHAKKTRHSNLRLTFDMNGQLLKAEMVDHD